MYQLLADTQYATCMRKLLDVVDYDALQILVVDSKKQALSSMSELGQESPGMALSTML